MMRFGWAIVFTAIILAACEPAPSGGVPTAVPFPTVTPGFVVQAVLPTLDGLRLDGGVGSPATAVALANQPSPTPNYGACPALAADTELAPKPDDPAQMAAEIARFLSAGGSPEALESRLNDEWDALGENGYVVGERDLTGEGSPDVVVGMVVPSGLPDAPLAGELLLLVCENSRYEVRYQEITADAFPPRLIDVTDMNYDGRADVVYTTGACDEDERCDYVTQALRWEPSLGRFASLLSRPINSDELPELRDVDNDRVTEIVVRLTDDGNVTTGPLRTGTLIYDWSGIAYVLSIPELDPLRYRIQVLHEADRAFARYDMPAAIDLYSITLSTDSDLRNWYNNEPEILRAYALYRTLLAYAYMDDDRLLIAFQDLSTLYPDPAAAPVYVALAATFWNNLQVTNDLNSACTDVRAQIETLPDALDLLNRYGTENPTYNAVALCPF